LAISTRYEEIVRRVDVHAVIIAAPNIAHGPLEPANARKCRDVDSQRFISRRSVLPSPKNASSQRSCAGRQYQIERGG